MDSQILKACKELIDNAQMGCADLVFKDICLEILSRAHHVLTEKEFRILVEYAAEKMKDKVSFEIKQELITPP